MSNNTDELFDRIQVALERSKKDNWVYLAMSDANHLNALRGEAPYSYGGLVHGYSAEQLTEIVDSFAAAVVKKLLNTGQS